MTLGKTQLLLSIFYFMLFSSLSNSQNTKQTLRDTLNLKNKIEKEGYLFYRYDNNPNHPLQNISKGPKINTLKITFKKDSLKQILPLEKNITIPFKDFKQWTQHTLNQLDLKGDSFSKLSFSNHIISNDTLYIEANIENSHPRFIDQFITKGYPKFPKKFIKHYYKTNQPFSKEILNEIEDKTQQLSFVNPRKPPEVLFTKDSTKVYLYLEKIKSNKLDALFGFTNNTNNNRFVFNGYIDLFLNNLINKGEEITFKWSSSGQNQQEINLKTSSPYILKTPFNLNYHLNIFRQDSSFVNTTQQFNLAYKLHYKHAISAFYQTQNSSAFNNTPDNFNKRQIGIIYNYTHLTPWKLIKNKIEIEFGIGNKQSFTNEEQKFIRSDLIKDIPLNNTHHINLRNRGAYLNTNNISNNEFFRTGGATTIRGFLEQSITSQLYNYSNIEYRLFSNTASYFQLFSDVGFFQKPNFIHRLISLGVGYTQSTKKGQLNINYAIGKEENSPFDLGNGLFHLNYVTYF